MLYRRADTRLAIPFGPFLAGAGWITMLWGDALKQIFNLPF